MAGSPSPSPSTALPHQPPPPPDKPTPPAKKRQRKVAEASSAHTAPDSPANPPAAPASSAPPSAAPVHPGLHPSVFTHQYPPPPFLMNGPGPYPVNGSPFAHQHPPPPHGYPPPPQGHGSPQPGAPMPPPPHNYGYHMPPPYASYPYQYAQPMMVYGSPAPHPDAAQQPAQSPSTPSASASTKRKRKGSGKGKEASDDEAAAAAALDKKRTKTQRACDSCRSRKIRCDILGDSEPPVCHHCKQYGFECTFFLPITETRFKKRKNDEDAPEKPESGAQATTSPEAQAVREGGAYGTSGTTRVYEQYDAHFQPSFEVSKGPDGRFHVRRPNPTTPAEEGSPHAQYDARAIPTDVVQDLVNAYFTDVAPLLPVVTPQELLAYKTPPPILFYSICLVSAGRREVPQMVFDQLRRTVNGLIKTEEVLSTASVVNVQSLLILCMMGDSHSPYVPSALSALWIRLGAAIRMAQDLGMHRAESVRQDIELRRRLWSACVICDRWYSLSFGHPFMIDVQDCDVRLPSSGNPNDVYLDELVRLSIVVGRVMKTLYSPSGLNLVTDDMLMNLLSEIEMWKSKLPESLQFKGPDTPTNPGLLHLLYACVNIAFWRAFMKISFTSPSHITFGLTTDRWDQVVAMTDEAIEWIDRHDRLYDVWLLVSYASTSCALAEYHNFARRKDSGAASKLRQLRDTVRRWEASLSPDHMSTRRKTAEIITLLYQASQDDPHHRVKQGPAQPQSTIGGVPGAGGAAALGKDTAGIPPPVTAAVEGSPLTGFPSPANVNPAMNSRHLPVASGEEIPSVPPNGFADLSGLDSLLLEGIPGEMFDWSQWDTFFSKFAPVEAST